MRQYGFLVVIFFLTTNLFSLTIDQAVEHALQARPSLKAQAAAVNATRAQAQRELTGYFPHVTLESSLTQNKGDKYLGISTTLAAQQLIFQHAGPLTRYEKKMQETEAEKSFYQREQQRIRFQVEQAFLDAYNLQQQREYFEALSRSSLLEHDKAKIQKSTALIGKQEYLNATFSFFNDTAHVKNYDEALAQAREVLNLVTAHNWHNQKLEWKSDTLAELKSLDLYAQLALKHRPDLQAMRQKIAALTLAEKITQSSRLPTISAAAHAGFARYPQNPHATGRNQGVYGFGLQASWDLFDGTTSYFQELIVEAQKTRQMLALEQMHLDISREVSEQYYACKTAHNNLQAERIRYMKDKNNFTKTKLKKISGLAVQTDLATAEASFKKARAGYLSALIEMHKSQRALLFACGYPPTA